MNYEKQTYLNTERLNELYSRERTVAASVPTGTTVGGIRFVCGVAHTVRLELTFPSLVGSYTPYIDGRPVMGKTAPAFVAEIALEKGEHIFEFIASASHGGAILRVAGVGVREGRRYCDCIGGYYTDTESIAYMKRGDHPVEKVTLQSGTVTVTSQTDTLRDTCLLYDKTNATYTADLMHVKSGSSTVLKVDTGQVTSLTVSALTSAAIADGQALPVGHDCLVAYVDSGVLHFLTAVRNGGITASTATVQGVKRVVSARRGTTLLVQDRENVWKAYVFGAGGDKSLTVGGSALSYTILPLMRSEVFAPTADLECPSLTHRFYGKDAKGVLFKKDTQGQTSAVGYADLCLAGNGNRLLVQDNEITIGTE